MIRVVVDTNVLVSAAIRRAGAEAAVLDLIARGELALCVSEPILAEYEAVLLRPKLNLSPELVKRLLQVVRDRSAVVAPGFTLAIPSDEADNRFLECAEEVQADFLITGNKRHFPASWKATTVVGPGSSSKYLPPIGNEPEHHQAAAY